MSNPIGAVMRRLPFGPLRTVQRFLDSPVGTQERLLRGLLRRAAETEWGRRYGFAEIARAPDVAAAYRDRVPLLHDYETLREDAERVRRGAADVLWPGAFRNFAVSSGTASAGKVLPVSDEMLAKNRAFSVGTGLNYLAASGRPGFLFGKHLTLPGRIEPDAGRPEAMVGEVSGLQAEHAPAFFARLYQAVPNEVAFLPNWERKLAAIADRTMEMDVRLLVMAPTWALVLFQRLIERYNQRHGGGARTVADVWPNLQVFISGGVALASYRDLLQAQIGLPALDFVETYGASEGFFSFQHGLGETDMLLHLDNGVFFEFVKLEDLHALKDGGPSPQRYTIGEVEPDVRYAPFISTCSGLWAYGVGDVVRFTSVSPHKIVVAGRTSEMLDTYGEAVFGEEARAALGVACEATGARVRDFHVAPRPARLDRLPAHQWLVEFERAPGDLAAFARAIDVHLQEVNRHYQIRREARAFEAPEVVPLPEGAFYAWLKNEKGEVSGQTKVPRMSEGRRVADGVLAAAGNNA